LITVNKVCSVIVSCFLFMVVLMPLSFASSANGNANAAPDKEEITVPAPDAGNKYPEIAKSSGSNKIQSQGIYSFDWQGTPVASSLYAIAKIAKKDIVINGKLEGAVYMSLHNVTAEYALDLLAKSFDFNWMIDENAIVVSTDDKMYQSKSFAVQYVDKENLVKELKALGIDEQKIYANEETGSISVTGTPYQLQQAEQRIAALDHPVSQCLILAQLIEVDHGNSLNLGLQYSLPTYSHTGSHDAAANTLRGNWLEKLTFSANVNADKAFSNGKVVARPMIMILNGREGQVNFGDKVPVPQTTSSSTSTNVSFDYKDVGTMLKATPVINEGTSEIKLKLEIEISTISQWVLYDKTKAPQISSRSAVTSANLKSGQSFVIGGLMSAKELDNLSGIPGLMDLPILGKLFRFHSKSREFAEIYIMITPYIVDGDTDPQALLGKYGEKNE